jgi:transketolase
MRNAYIKKLYELAGQDSRIMALVSDNGAIVYDEFRRDFTDRFINFGISEANMIGTAAGLAACGKIPFAYTISNFLTMRAFEQVRNDVCLQKMNVKLVGIGAGFIYSDLGPTHHSTEDIALMQILPGMTVLSPADPLESSYCTEAALQIDGPVFLRLGTGGTPVLYSEPYDFQVGKGVVLRDGDDLTIFATGAIVQETVTAVDQLKEKGISARLINLHTIKPIDIEIICKAAKETGAILTVEEHSVHGGLGSSVLAALHEDYSSSPVCFKRMGLQDKFSVGYGSYQDMKEMNGLSSKDIINEVQNLVDHKVNDKQFQT